MEIERAALQASHHDLERLGEHFWRLIRVDAVVARLDRRDAAPDAELETPAAHLVEHADFLDQAQRMIERQRVDQRPAEPPRTLRDCGEENAGRGCHAERRRVVLGHVIGVKAKAVIGFGELQAILIEFGERQPGAVEMIEYAECQHVPAPHQRIMVTR